MSATDISIRILHLLPILSSSATLMFAVDEHIFLKTWMHPELRERANSHLPAVSNSVELSFPLFGCFKNPMNVLRVLRHLYTPFYSQLFLDLAILTHRCCSGSLNGFDAADGPSFSATQSTTPLPSPTLSWRASIHSPPMLHNGMDWACYSAWDILQSSERRLLDSWRMLGKIVRREMPRTQWVFGSR